MKIIHVIESLDVGGAERALLDIIHFRPDQSVEHRIVCLAGPGPLEDEAIALNVAVDVLHKNPGFDWTLPKKLRQVFSNWQPDLIHTHLFTGNLWGRWAAKGCSIPLLMSVQNLDSWITGWRAHAEKYLINVPKLTVAVSESAYEERRRFGLSEDRCRIIANGSSRTPKPNARVERRQRWGVSSSIPIIGVLARCIDQKNPRLFVDLAEKVRQTHSEAVFVWVGDGEARDLFKKSNNDGILFVGHDDDAMGALAAFDVQLSTSHREGSSLALVEGMRSALPVVATDVPGNRDLLKDLAGAKLFDPSKPEDGVKALTDLLDDPNLRRKRGQLLCGEVRHHYSAETMSERYHEIYRELITS